MRRLACWVVILAVLAGLGGGLWAKDYKLIDGSTIIGEASDGNDYGVVFRLSSGGFSKRISYSKFTQEALKLLAENERLKPLAEPFIEVPPEPKPKPKPIVLREVTRVDRPVGRTSFFSSFTAPMGLAVLALLYLANLVAGYEIAIYRNRPVAVVCGLSALLPLLGPLIFLVSPSLEEQVPDEAAAAPPTPEELAAADSSGGSIGKGMVPIPGGGTALKVASAGKGASGKAETRVFNRGEVEFNRRFVETTFQGFFRVVPSEAERDLVLVIKTPKSEYVGRRITRISANEFFLQLLGGAGKEVSISFGEVAQIAIRHKDDVRG